jgi:glucose-6-phosphate isomerase
MESKLSVNIDWPETVEAPGAPGDKLAAVQEDLESGSVPGSAFLGWLDWADRIDEELLERVESVAAEIREHADVFVLAGIGGSYLGARAVIEALGDPGEAPEIRYAGNQLSGPHHERLLEDIEGRSTYVNVVSKSGTTTETALAFRLLRHHLENRYSEEECARRIIATTDAKEGALVEAAEEAGYRRFVIPDDVGGRFSVLTPVGLLPIAVAGIDVRSLLEGARRMSKRVRDQFESPATRYAHARNYLYEKGMTHELFGSFYPELSYVGKWWQQLFGESEGKEGEGLYPDTVEFTTDLHSMGQYIQQGPRQLFETMPVIDERSSRPEIPYEPNNLDGMNYLSGQPIETVNREALEGTVEAHVDGGVPVIKIGIPRLNADYLGRLLYFFMYSCALSALKLGVNPFNQPGVEAYKTNMFRRLDHPDY